MSRWVVADEDPAVLTWTLRCPECDHEQVETVEGLRRVGWPQHPHTDPWSAKPTLRCRDCGYEPHLPRPFDLESDRQAIGR